MADGRRRAARLTRRRPPLGCAAGASDPLPGWYPALTLPNTFSMGTRPIAGDDLHARMLAQPRRQSGGLPIGQINDIVALKVHQRGAVVMASAPGPVIHSTPNSRNVAGGMAPRPVARVIRSSVSGLIAMARRSASRAPASPPSARPIQRCRSSRRRVQRSVGGVTPPSCSAKVFREQSGLRQRNRRAWMSSVTARCCQGRSLRLRQLVAVNSARGHVTARTVGGPGAGLGKDADAISRGQGLLDQQPRWKKG